jgi:hypothetical protein
VAAKEAIKKLHTNFIEIRACLLSRATFLVEDNPESLGGILLERCSKTT